MEKQDDNLSVLLDGDEAANLDAAIDNVCADVNVQYRMRRYQMIGAVMRNELPAAIDTGFHAEVMAQIRNEASAPAPREDRSTTVAVSASGVSNWFKPFAGLAVAASVALVTVALWGPQQQDGGASDGLVLADQDMVDQEMADQEKIEQLASQPLAGGAVPVSSRIQTDGMRWQMQNESAVLQQKLNAYLVNHTEYSNSMQGLIPQARVAGFDAQP